MSGPMMPPPPPGRRRSRWRRALSAVGDLLVFLGDLADLFT